jgi:hypothetical protein
MSLKATTDATERLPASLFTTYRTYKLGTSVVINWLASFDESLTTLTDDSSASTSDSENAPTPQMNVRQIINLARKAAQDAKQHPLGIKIAFKSVLVNRSKLIKYWWWKCFEPETIILG